MNIQELVKKLKDNNINFYDCSVINHYDNYNNLYYLKVSIDTNYFDTEQLKEIFGDIYNIGQEKINKKYFRLFFTIRTNKNPNRNVFVFNLYDLNQSMMKIEKVNYAKFFQEHPEELTLGDFYENFAEAKEAYREVMLETKDGEIDENYEKEKDYINNLKETDL